MELSLIEIWESMGLLARLVAIALVIMGVASLAISVERLLVLGRIKRESALFAGKARTLLEAREYGPLRDLARGMPRTPLARLTEVGLGTFLDHRGAGISAGEATRRELARRLEEYGQEARRGMGLLLLQPDHSTATDNHNSRSEPFQPPLGGFSFSRTTRTWSLEYAVSGTVVARMRHRRDEVEARTHAGMTRCDASAPSSSRA
jgi:hypothetical protein